jgi:hypothetical protein
MISSLNNRITNLEEVTDINATTITTTNATISNATITNVSSISTYDNDIFIRVIAMAKVDNNGNNEKKANCVVLRTGIGEYTLTLNKPRPTSTYVISLTIAEHYSTRDDVIIQVARNSVQPQTFKYFIHEQDNAGSAGVFKDAPHFVTVTDFD